MNALIFKFPKYRCPEKYGKHVPILNKTMIIKKHIAKSIHVDLSSKKNLPSGRFRKFFSVRRFI